MSLPGLYANMMTFSAGPRVRQYLPSTCDFEISTKLLVVYRPALFADRDEDIHVHPNYQLCLLRVRREGCQGERVCIATALTEGCLLKAYSVLTRPYLSRKFKEGSQCPMIVTPYVHDGNM